MKQIKPQVINRKQSLKRNLKNLISSSEEEHTLKNIKLMHANIVIVSQKEEDTHELSRHLISMGAAISNIEDLSKTETVFKDQDIDLLLVYDSNKMLSAKGIKDYYKYRSTHDNAAPLLFLTSHLPVSNNADFSKDSFSMILSIDTHINKICDSVEMIIDYSIDQSLFE